MTKRNLAIAFITITGLIHLVLSPEYLEEQPYIGVLFMLGAVACGLVGLMLKRNARDGRAWLLGSLVSVGMGAGFVLSRTVGLPGFHESEWELSGIVTLLAEAGFVAIAATSLQTAARTARTASARSASPS